MWEVHENRFIPHFPCYIFIIIFCCSFTFHCRRSLLINIFNKMDSFLCAFGLLTFLYFLRLASVEPTHHIFFSMYQVVYTSTVWSVHSLPPLKQLPNKNRIFTGADIRNGKSSMLYDSNLWTSIAGKSKTRANYVLVSLWKNHFDCKWDIDLQIQN